ncbi:MAG: transcription termination/antitermination factor NusG [Eubacterium sp.]|jgi:transcriptional antiterminator NusG|nr:transcription termination/antitermination factor NusG [Eubacterium sp.]HBE10524.1 transcription termination/antitermination factor NusG [Lachnospiraceae bacterium]
MSEINEEAVEQVKRPTSVKQIEDTEPHWYVVHTYSGYENKVKADIEKTIENRKLQGQMLEVMVPLQDVVETKNGVKKTVSKKMFPGYVLVHMIKNDVTWYVVRNTRGVTGFVGPGSEPVPLTEAEMKKLGVKLPNEVIDIDVEIGDVIKVVSGAWEGTDGTIKSINAGKQTVTIDVDIFGRSTSVEIGLGDIEKL